MTDRPPYPWDPEHPPQEWPAEPSWIQVAEVNNDAAGDSVWADTIRHCKTWRQMQDRSRTTTAHECTHGINSQLRNAAGTRYEIGWKMQASPSGGEPYRLPVPIPADIFGLYGESGERKNGFYVLGGRGITLREPGIRKSDVAPAVPRELRGDRFGLYVVQSRDWDDSPLYIFDEKVSYLNGAKCALDMVARGENPGQSDHVRSLTEFSVYGLAMLYAVESGAPGDLETLLPFSRWLWAEAWKTYYKGKPIFPFSGQDEYEAAFFGAPGATLRAFAAKYNFPNPKG